MDLPRDVPVEANVDDAFAGNLLLATLSADQRALFEPHMEIVTLGVGDTVLAVGESPRRTLFPFAGLMVSMRRELSGGRSVEVASIGREGAVGGIISCGEAPAFTQVVVQLPGKAATIPMAVLDRAKLDDDHIRNLFCRYSDALLAQVMQSVACNAFHPIEARAARWLLHAADRAASDRLELTQESFAGLLGVQRTTVNAVARVLQEQGLIAYRRGAIQVIDRAGLTRVSCDCYSAVEDHFRKVLGPDGKGTRA